MSESVPANNEDSEVLENNGVYDEVFEEKEAEIEAICTALKKGKESKASKERLFGRNCAESIIDRLINEERQKVLQMVTHSVMPAFNINIKKTKLENLSNYPHFKSSIPHSVYVSPEHPNKLDLCHKRTVAHFDYMYNLNRQRAFYEIAAKKKEFKKSIKRGVYPYTVIRYAELLENNPDPYFQARYDWYYTGGNLECYSENNLICHSIGSNLNQLALSRLKRKSKTHNLKKFKAMDFLQLDDLDNLEIFEIQSLPLKNRFSVRQKYSLSLLTYDENDLICDYIISNHNLPIITSACNNLDSEIIAIGNLNKEVLLWDVKNSTKAPKQTLFENNSHSEKSKNWNSLCTLDENTFGFTTLKEFCILDIRQSAKESNTNLCTFGKYKERCEDISSLAKSSYDHLIYFGTTHKLFTVDIRFMDKAITDKYIIQRWTHQMESPPLLLKTYKWSDNYELIAMSSLLSGDIRICENFRKFKNDKYKFISPCLPFMPPSLLDGYKAAKINGECLDPVTNLEKRINSCTTGLDFLKKSNKLYLMLSNSLGDVFATKLNFDDDIIYTDHNNKEIIMKYDEKVKLKLENNPLSLNLTDFVQLKGMSRLLRCKRFNKSSKNLENSYYKDEESMANDDDNDEPLRLKRKAKWQKSISELYAYKDVLASNLLSVWDMEITEEKNILPVLNKKTKKTRDLDKVNEWINESNFLNDTLPIDDSLADSNRINFNTVIHSTIKPTKEGTAIIDDSFRINENNITMEEFNRNEKMEIDASLKSHSDTEIPPGQIPPVINKPKISEKRKRNYVKGF